MKYRQATNVTMPQIARISQLARAGLSDQAVAIVMNLDYELVLTAENVRYRRRVFGGVRHPARGRGLACVSKVSE